METVEAVQLQRDSVIEKALHNDLIVENILSFLPSKDLFNMRLVNYFLNMLAKKEIQKRGDILVHLTNNNDINNFMELLDKSYLDLDTWSPYSFKIPMGDIDKDVLETFATKVGSRIKILDLNEGYNDKKYITITRDHVKYLVESSLSVDYSIYAHGIGRVFPPPRNSEEFLIATRTMPKIWALLKSVSESLRELSLSLCSEVILHSGKFPEQIPRFQRLKKLNLIYGEKRFLNYRQFNEFEFENLDWKEIWNGDPDDKLFKNFVAKARNMTSGHIVAREHGYSRIFAEIGSIQFANGGKPTLELKGSFGVPQIPFIRNLVNQNYSQRITDLDLQLCCCNNDWLPRHPATQIQFLELLHLVHDFILNQCQSLEILIISINEGRFVEFDWPNLDFNPPFPAQNQTFSKLKRFQLKPNRGQEYKFLKAFFRGNFPVLKELYLFYDQDDTTYIEAPNVTMPKELLEATRKNYRRMMKEVKNFYP